MKSSPELFFSFSNAEKIISKTLMIHTGIVKIILMIQAKIDKITFAISRLWTLAEFRFPCLLAFCRLLLYRR